MKQQEIIWGLVRISLGLIFLWAFFDKLIGLGFSTCLNEEGKTEVMCDSAWLKGGSPTTGFLKFGTKGPLAGVYQAIAGSAFIDWLFMLGLLGIGTALILGIGMKLATYSGVLLLMMMWAGALLPEHHPFLDDHIIYSLVLLGLYHLKAGQWLGFANKWTKSKLVKKFPFLE